MRKTLFAAMILVGAAAAAAQEPATATPTPSPAAAQPSPPAKVQMPAPAAASILPPPAVVANPSNRLSLQLSTGGTVVIQLRPDIAPQNVARIQTLVQRGFYNGLVFHRVVPGFMAQGGDPQGNGQGGSELPDLPAEFTTIPHMRGTVAMARAAEANSANSQFYIMLGRNPDLDNIYTVIGRVIAGMDAVDKIAPGEPPEQPTKIVRASLGG